ncbi:MAG TPA: hypothetical protein DEQ40_14355 [Oxalobacteraceae bacterium]|nr:hypothetical protein [Oxalobacteraceae bacterium]
MQHPADTIKYIADVAEAFADAAGVGGVETAGAIISYLAAHPDMVGNFMEDGPEFLMNVDARRIHADGRLTWHRGGDGKVVTPRDLRISLTVRDMAKPE